MSTMCELDCGSYMEIVAASQDKCLGLFATKVGSDRLHIDLNQCVSPDDAMTSTRNVSLDDMVEVNDTSQPCLSQQIELEMDASDQVKGHLHP